MHFLHHDKEKHDKDHHEKHDKHDKEHHLAKKPETTDTTITDSRSHHSEMMYSGKTVPPPVFLCGYLRKQSPSMLHMWQKRYFVFLLEERALAYFHHKDDAAAQGKRRGTIFIKDIQSIESLGDEDFHIITPERTYNLQTATKHARDVWVDSLRLIRETLVSANQRGLDVAATDMAIEDALRTLSFKEGRAIAADFLEDRKDVSSVDVHGNPHHGRAVDSESLVPREKVVENVVEVTTVPVDIITERTVVSQEGNVVVEKQEITIEKEQMAIVEPSSDYSRGYPSATSHPEGLPTTEGKWSTGYPSQGPTGIPMTESKYTTGLPSEFSHAQRTEGYVPPMTESSQWSTGHPTTMEDLAGKTRNFHIIERDVGAVGAEKEYNFQAPTENEVSFKFSTSTPNEQTTTTYDKNITNAGEVIETKTYTSESTNQGFVDKAVSQEQMGFPTSFSMNGKQYEFEQNMPVAGDDLSDLRKPMTQPGFASTNNATL